MTIDGLYEVLDCLPSRRDDFIARFATYDCERWTLSAHCLRMMWPDLEA